MKIKKLFEHLNAPIELLIRGFKEKHIPKYRVACYSYLEPPSATLDLVGALRQPGGGDLATVRPGHVAVTHLPAEDGVNIRGDIEAEARSSLSAVCLTCLGSGPCPPA